MRVHPSRPLVLSLLALATRVASAQAFGNAGFESPAVAEHAFLSGVDSPTFAAPWFGAHSFGIANGSGSWGTAAHSGSQYAYVQSTNEFGGAGSMFQTLNGLTIGGTYSINFWMARRNGNVGANNSNAISVLAGTQTILAPTFSPDATWRSYTTAAFVATSTSVTITFQGQVPTSTMTDTASLLDDVTLTPTPEPAPFVGLGLGTLVLLRRRRAEARRRAPSVP